MTRIVSFFILLCLLFGGQTPLLPAAQTKRPISVSPDNLPLFKRNLACSDEYPGDTPLFAAVVPHYAPVQDMLVKALRAAKEGLREDATVVLLAPNHAGEGPAVQLWGGGFSLGRDIIEGDASLLDALLAAPGAFTQQTARYIERDHSVMSVVPYVRAILPGVKILPILLSRGASGQQLDALASALADYAAANPLFLLGSVDFSHDQTPEYARFYDGETQNAIQNGRWDILMTFGPEHLDAPQVMTVLLLLAERNGLSFQEVETRREDYVENGEKKAGSFMTWLCAAA